MQIGPNLLPGNLRDGLVRWIPILLLVTLLGVFVLGCGKSDEQLLTDLNSSDANTRVEAVLELLDRGHPAAQSTEVTDWLLVSAASMLDENAQWTNRSYARDYYDALQETEDYLVNDSIVRYVLVSDVRLRVLYLAMKLGTPGSEQQLIEVLDSHGDKEMAEDFLNCGSILLSDAAEDWAARHGYVVYTVTGGPRVSWGQF